MKAIRNISLILALVAALAIAPAAMADPAVCSTSTWSNLPGDGTPISAATICTEGAFTINFASGGVSSTGSVNFNSVLTTPTNLGFQVSASLPGPPPATPLDINLVYQVTGVSGLVTIDNSFTGVGSITEYVCAANPDITSCNNTNALAVIFNNTGAEMTATFTSTGSFWIDKDVEDNTFSEFNDSFDVTPEPSSLLMFGTGLLGLAGMLRHKFQRSR
jgi:hypothetical protein